MYGAGCWAYNQRSDRSGVAVATSGKFLFINQTVILICTCPGHFITSLAWLFVTLVLF